MATAAKKKKKTTKKVAKKPTKKPAKKTVKKDPLAVKLGETLFAIRDELGLTGRQVTERMQKLKFTGHRDHSQLSRYEWGKRIPPLLTLIGLATVYGTTVGDILEESGLEKIAMKQQRQRSKSKR